MSQINYLKLKVFLTSAAVLMGALGIGCPAPLNMPGLDACPYDALYMHPDEHTAAKCNYCSHRTDIVLDPFCGSGTILIAAERTGRSARAIELDPLYVDVAVRRWQRFTGRDAVHAETGRTFDETCEHAQRKPFDRAEGQAK